MEKHHIRKRVKVLRIYIEATDTKLSVMERIRDKFIGHREVDVLRPRLQELKKDHQSLKERLHEFCNESGVSRGSVHDPSERLLSLQREQELVKDRCYDLNIEFLEAESVLIKEKKSQAKTTTTSQEEREAVHDQEEREAGDRNLVFDTNVEGLKPIMSHFMLKDEASVIHDVEHPKPLIDWIKEIGDSDKDWEVIKAIKGRAVEAGAELSRLLVDVIIMMSESAHVIEMLGNFISSLEYCGGEKPIVINKFVNLLRMTDREIKKKKYSGGSSNDVSQDKKASVDQNQFDELFDKFLDGILYLEMILKEYGLPDSKIWKDKALYNLKAGIQLYEEDFKAVESKVTELRVLYSFTHELTDTQKLTDLDESLRREMGLKIDELWSQLEEPREALQGSSNV